MNAILDARRPDHGWIIADPVFMRDGRLCVRPAGVDIPLLLNGAPIARLVEGWRATALFTGFAPLFLLEFVSEEGMTATWFLDYRFHQVGSSVAALQPAVLDLLRARATPLLGLLMYSMLEQCDVALDPRVEAFFQVNEGTRQAIGVACIDGLILPPASFLAEHLEPQALLYRGDGGVLRTIDKTHLANGLQQDWQDRIAGFLRAGCMTWPSPVDGRPVVAQGSFVFDDFHFGYRFCDHRNRLVFIVLVAEHHSRIAGVWLPCMNLLVSHDEYHRCLGRLFVSLIPRWFVEHPMQWGLALASQFGRGATRIVSVMRGRPGTHIGHQLWNELSGIERLVVEAPDALPEWLVLNAADDVELYGPIDVLFPELEGRVNRELRDVRSMIEWAYSSDVLVLRVTRERVSAGLRHRVQAHLSGQAAARHVAEQVATLAGGPLLLFGLRVENRTMVDLPGFLIRMLKRLAVEFPGINVVFDGHNARGEGASGQLIESHGEGHHTARPAEVERRLLIEVRHALGGHDITILDTIGLPLSASIAWGMSADCFVSIWGASLAKYRWICNATGFVLTSRHNLLHRPDLRIYDAPRYMEDPTLLRFPDPGPIVDDPEAALLINVAPGRASFFNFRVDETVILPQIVDLVACSRREWRRERGIDDDSRPAPRRQTGKAATRRLLEPMPTRAL